MLKKARLLTRPTLAASSPSRPEPAKTGLLPKDAPCPKQGLSSEADLPFTFHASRLTVLGSDARAMLADFFSIPLDNTRPIYDEEESAAFAPPAFRGTGPLPLFPSIRPIFRRSPSVTNW